MTNDAIRQLVRRAMEEPGFLDSLMTNPKAFGYCVGMNRPDELRALPTTSSVGCGDGPTCGVTCSHTCSGGYTMSCGGTCDHTCDYTAGRAMAD